MQTGAGGADGDLFHVVQLQPVRLSIELSTVVVHCVHCVHGAGFGVLHHFRPFTGLERTEPVLGMGGVAVPQRPGLSVRRIVQEVGLALDVTTKRLSTDGIPLKRKKTRGIDHDGLMPVLIHKGLWVGPRGVGGPSGPRRDKGLFPIDGRVGVVGAAEDIAPVHVDAGLLCTGGVQGWPSDGGGGGGGSGGGGGGGGFVGKDVVSVGVQGDLGGGNGVVGKDVINVGVQ